LNSSFAASFNFCRFVQSARGTQKGAYLIPRLLHIWASIQAMRDLDQAKHTGGDVFDGHQSEVTLFNEDLLPDYPFGLEIAYKATREAPSFEWRQETSFEFKAFGTKRTINSAFGGRESQTEVSYTFSVKNNPTEYCFGTNFARGLTLYKSEGTCGVPGVEVALKGKASFAGCFGAGNFSTSQVISDGIDSLITLEVSVGSWKHVFLPIKAIRSL
jgi:hypothetical protein